MASGDAQRFVIDTPASIIRAAFFVQQELLLNADVTTMIYTHLLKVGGGGVISPLDRM